MNAPLPVIGLMPGDVTGIGPEITAKILAQGYGRDRARIVVIGDARVLEVGMRDAGVSLELRRYPAPRDVDWSAPGIPLVDLGNIDPAQFKRGESSPESGKLTGDTLKTMIDFAREGQLDGICFAPLNKGRDEPRRLEVRRRAPDVRGAHRPQGLLQRDERHPGVLDVPRDLAHLAAQGSRPT